MKKDTRIRYGIEQDEPYYFSGTRVAALYVNSYSDLGWSASLTLVDGGVVTVYKGWELAAWPDWAQSLVREHVTVPEGPSLREYAGQVMFVTAMDGVPLAEPVLYFRDSDGDWSPEDVNQPGLLDNGVVYAGPGTKVTDWRPANITVGEHA